MVCVIASNRIRRRGGIASRLRSLDPASFKQLQGKLESTRWVARTLIWTAMIEDGRLKIEDGRLKIENDEGKLKRSGFPTSNFMNERKLKT